MPSKSQTTERRVTTVNNIYQESDLDHMFETGKQAQEKGDLYEALRLYKKVADQNPYYPELDIRMRALEMEMMLGPVPSHHKRRFEPVRQPPKPLTAHRPQSAQPARRRSGYISPYLLYGAITFLSAIILTLILAVVVFPNWNWVFIWLIVINLITFLVYGYDKLISPTETVRVPEMILVFAVLAGAFVGGLLARMRFRHKTRKLSFRLKFWIAEIICITWVVIYYAFIW